MEHREVVDGLKIGDLVEKVGGPRRRCLAIIIEMCIENYFEFNPWIRVAYVDGFGGYEWVHRHGLKITKDKEQK
tara:strand:+ start:832 stop:1053 length:222 start_codon:yes stop_codon:yes gene_type:complete